MKNKATAYKDVIKNGDILFFTGTVWTSFVIQLVDGGHSHVGMAHWVGSDLYVLHSASSSTIQGEGSFAGVQMTPLSVMWNIEMYTKMHIKRLHMTPQQYKVCKQTFLEWYGIPYDRNPICSWLCQTTPQTSINCIQLIVLMLSKANIVSPKMRINKLSYLCDSIHTEYKPSITPCGQFFVCIPNRDATQTQITQGKSLAKRWLM